MTILLGYSIIPIYIALLNKIFSYPIQRTKNRVHWVRLKWRWWIDMGHVGTTWGITMWTRLYVNPLSVSGPDFFFLGSLSSNQISNPGGRVEAAYFLCPGHWANREKKRCTMWLSVFPSYPRMGCLKCVGGVGHHAKHGAQLGYDEIGWNEIRYNAVDCNKSGKDEK